MISKFVLPMLLISCLAGCATQDSYSKALGLPDTTSSQKKQGDHDLNNLERRNSPESPAHLRMRGAFPFSGLRVRRAIFSAIACGIA